MGRNSQGDSRVIASSIGTVPEAEGGTIEVTAPLVEISAGGAIASETGGPGNAGTVQLQVSNSRSIVIEQQIIPIILGRIKRQK